MRIYEINSRVHCNNFGEITIDELAGLKALGFDSVWMMGVWQISDGARKISRITDEDFEGSPYAVPVYEINRELGGKNQFLRLRERAHDAGLSVVVDFVSNHMALDSPWLNQRPDLFIRSDIKSRKQSTNEFFLHASGEVIAFGRDPYFPPWHDTAQLDYANPALRKRMIEVLTRISSFADGVRCDMAMLVIRDCFRQLWYPLLPDHQFDAMMPGEFWDQAVREVKKRNPDFKFIAEAYWDREEHLASLGFDLCYEKKLYDALVAHDLARVLERLQRSPAALTRSLHFIENHDEPRAAATFSRSDNLAALALVLAIPGSVLIHEGQMDGKRERLPVQRIRPLVNEVPDVSLRESYARLLKITDDDVFRNGELQLFDPGVYGALGLIRREQRRVVAFLAQISEAWHKFNSPQMNVSAVARASGAQRAMRVTNLLNSESVTIHENDGGFQLQTHRLGLNEEDKFCLVEVSPE